MSVGRRASGSITSLGVLALALVAALAPAGLAGAQEHRAEQDREITYWMLDPDSASFRISHDFTVDTAGERYVHNFVRAGSEVSEPTFYDLNRGVRLESRMISGAELNAMGVYPRTLPDDAVVVQAELVEPVAAGHSVRIRVVETYTDRERYYLEDAELVWDRSLGRPYNVVKLPPGWRLTAVNTPATVELDDEDLVSLRFINPRNDSLAVVIRARRR